MKELNQSSTQDVEKTSVLTKKEGKRKRKKAKIIGIVILIIIAIGVGLFVGYQKLSSNPLSVYKKAINETYKLANNFLEENKKNTMTINYLEEPFAMETNFTLNSDSEEYQALSNYEYRLSLGFNIPNEQMNLSFGLNDDEGKIIRLLLAFMNDHAYLQSEELYSEVLDLGLSELNFSELTMENIANYDYNDLQVVLSNMKEILINSLDKDKFSYEDETINISGKETNAKKFTYLLDRENMERTINYITNEMLKKDELMTSLSNITGLTKEEIDYSNYTEITINLYTNNRNEIVAGNLTEDNSALIRFTYQEETFDLFVGDEYENMTVNIKDNTMSMAYEEYGEELLSLSFSGEEDRQNMDITINDYGDIINLKIDFSNIEMNETYYYADFVIDCTLTSYGVDSNFELKGNLGLKKGELTTIDPENSVSIDSLTEEQASIFYENLLNVLERLGLSSYFESL